MIRTGIDLLDKKGEIIGGSMNAITGLMGNGGKNIFFSSIMASLHQDRSVIVVLNMFTIDELIYGLAANHFGTQNIEDNELQKFLDQFLKKLNVLMVDNNVKDNFIESMYILTRENPTSKDVFIDDVLFCKEYEAIRYLAQSKNLRVLFHCILPKSEDGIELRVQKIFTQTGCMQFRNILYIRKDVVNRTMNMKYLKNNFDNDHSNHVCRNFDLRTSAFGGFY